MQFMYEHFSGLVYWHLRGTSGIPTEYIATTKYNRVHNSQDAMRLRKKSILHSKMAAMLLNSL